MWKDCNVILLENNTIPKIGDFVISLIGNKLFSGIKVRESEIEEINQHLYITSDEEIKEGDWMYSKMDGYPTKWDGDLSETKNPKEYGYNKIITTTDKLQILNGYLDDDGSKFYLPQLSKQFIQHYIEEYNKGNVITKVEVEYELTDSAKACRSLHINTIYRSNLENYSLENKTKLFDSLNSTKLKVNPDNTINIKPIKDSWNREEVIGIIHSICGNMYKKHIIYSPLTVNEWIKENL